MFRSFRILTRRCSSQSLIKQHTEVSRDHLTPELRLHLITRNCPIFYARPGQDSSSVPFPDPYWGFYWPGGQALTRFILDNPEVVRGKGVVDFGCGCGSGAIAAIMSECSQVLVNDIDPYAIVAARLNAALNDVDISKCVFSTDNLLGSDIDARWSVFLVGDMFYSDELGSQLHRWFSNLAKNSKRTILIGDPGRWQFSNSPIREKVQLRMSYSLPDEAALENTIHSTSVFSYVYEE